MNVDAMIERQTAQADRILALVAGVSEEQARWKPDPESWSILEVICHLYDEEREDFRVRLEILLRKPSMDMPPIDPQGWVTARRYNERDLTEMLAGFLAERAQSQQWLRTLTAPNWDNGVDTPWGWRVTAGDMAAAWLAHDLLHTRQLVELHWAWLQREVAPYKTEYAGGW